MSPYGLPTAGYPASARWHVFSFPLFSYVLSYFSFQLSAFPLKPPLASMLFGEFLTRFVAGWHRDRLFVHGVKMLLN